MRVPPVFKSLGDNNMKGQSTWSYRPFRPVLWDVGAPYICRIVPSPCGIHVEWLPENVERYDVFIRKIGEGEFAPCGGTSDCFFDIRNLECGIDYEFYVTSGEKKSRTRLARCGSVEGSVVNYLHPLDGAYAFSGQYLASPSLLMHPDGYLLASMDVYLAYGGQNLSFIFRSDDGGENWYYVNDIMPSFWGKLFLHRGDVYMLTCSTEYGDLLIGKSSDGGKTFSAPITLLRGLGGKGPKGGIKKTLGVHKNAVDGDFGAKYEKYKCCGEGDMTPFWNACGVDGIFVGHCHMNNTSILYNGVRLTFGLKTGAYDYYTNGQLGGTVIQCEESGTFDVRHITTLVPYDPPFPM